MFLCEVEIMTKMMQKMLLRQKNRTFFFPGCVYVCVQLPNKSHKRSVCVCAGQQVARSNRRLGEFAKLGVCVRFTSIDHFFYHKLCNWFVSVVHELEIVFTHKTLGEESTGKFNYRFSMLLTT